MKGYNIAIAIGVASLRCSYRYRSGEDPLLHDLFTYLSTLYTIFTTDIMILIYSYVHPEILAMYGTKGMNHIMRFRRW